MMVLKAGSDVMAGLDRPTEPVAPAFGAGKAQMSAAVHSRRARHAAMTLQIVEPELFSVTESSLTVSFEVRDGAGLVDAESVVLVNGLERATCGGIVGTRMVRVDGLEPGSEQRLEIRAGSARSQPSKYFPETARTLAAPDSEVVATFATLNDLHFGEPRFGGTLLPDGEYGDASP